VSDIAVCGRSGRHFEVLFAVRAGGREQD
jgi:hypothetical protein